MSDSKCSPIIVNIFKNSAVIQKQSYYYMHCLQFPAYNLQVLPVETQLLQSCFKCAWFDVSVALTSLSNNIIKICGIPVRFGLIQF